MKKVAMKVELQNERLQIILGGGYELEEYLQK